MLQQLLHLLGNQPLFTFTVTGGASPRVLAFEGVESTSAVYEYLIEVACLDDDYEDLLDREACLTIEGWIEPRKVHGYIHSVEYLGRAGAYHRMRLRLVPRLWCLDNRRASRIFQDTSTVDIVLGLLREHGIATPRVRTVLHQTYAPRDYCVQYRESDLAFISRLLEEDGIFYYFEHTEADHVLVLCDNSAVCPEVPGGPLLPYREDHGLINAGEHVHGFRMRQAVRPGRVTLRDYYFPQPHERMEVSEQVDANAEWELYDYPGEYRNPGRGGPESGAAIARTRLAEVQATRREYYGRSDCGRLRPGHWLALADHPGTHHNGEFLLVRVRHSGRQPQVLDEQASEGDFAYENEFACIPLATQYRPPRVTPRPVVHGLQPATVVGPEGEEIHTDNQGRVIVQFHWDRRDGFDERSSCWIRVSYPWAGPGYGIAFIPRIGHEVLIDFLEGDPDRPLIVGRVYTGSNAHPYELPDHKTRSTIKTESSPGGGGYNELRFEDRKGSEEIFVHGQKDMNTRIRNCETRRVGNSRSTTIGTVDSTLVGIKQTITIAQPSEPPPTIPPTGSEMSNKKYRLTTGEATVTLDGPNITLEADGNIRLIAKGTIEFQSTAADIKGEAATTLSIAAKGGDLKINGGPNVKINM
ncbi:type VI secretion system tip protein TssI/VgrG [Nannocystis sp. SCPEA4]|uniref:type VI secretion system Vgr family protein n=1 Tax=Nannocystis sp. SCPEA4 TaxID=2996787 RepID=UPI00226EF890|nr:type VI secretion system tip protein TssI/VgrG [Nannocystis sp. SCPEA4]MCY1061621.1 type VI secretion system tip protein TssI/VgrG [Nannocystis sp. SCPEA4]